MQPNKGGSAYSLLGAMQTAQRQMATRRCMKRQVAAWPLGQQLLRKKRACWLHRGPVSGQMIMGARRPSHVVSCHRWNADRFHASHLQLCRETRVPKLDPHKGPLPTKTDRVRGRRNGRPRRCQLKRCKSTAASSVSDSARRSTSSSCKNLVPRTAL